ncbi:MAG TPA: UMP kinase [Candidatus Omnitrophica bacterium]|nr:UMP kinase [Candidatus Omnitrophota bacterium]
MSYKRIMLKLSGEALSKEGEQGIDHESVMDLAKEIQSVAKKGIQIVIVVGGGNIWRWRDTTESGIERTASDAIGMLATIMNSVALQSALESLGAETRVLSAIDIPQMAEAFIRRRAIRHLEKGRVVIFVGGIGSPFFTTDTTAALRAIEIGAGVVLKATNVDGVYSADPARNPGAKRFSRLSFTEVLKRNLKVMDATAVSLCRENRVPIIVFNLHRPGNIRRAVCGEPVGTIVDNR